ncbi:hypothetical protein SESBI_07767 [Sesbania bispinosa]|nr:hypothetical protein SESBI_07767 [Sesbania bispinosa]
MKKNLSTANTFHLEKILQQSVQGRTLQCNLGPTKYEKTLSLNQGSLGCNQEAHLIPLGTNKSAIRPPKLVQKNDTRESKPKDEIQHDKDEIRYDKGEVQARTHSGSTTLFCIRNLEKEKVPPLDPMITQGRGERNMFLHN